MSGGSPAAFAMNSMLGFDKLALKCKFDFRLSGRLCWCVSKRTVTGKGSRAAVFLCRFVDFGYKDNLFRIAGNVTNHKH